MVGSFMPVSGHADIIAKPSFSEISCPKKRKEEFVVYFSELIRTENALILKDRSRIRALRREYNAQEKLSPENTVWLRQISKKYKYTRFSVTSQDHWVNLLNKVDQLPPNLILAQAALESGWGTSRFSVEGNNFFGQWCFSKGCGIIPEKRKPGLIHEVQRFENARASLSAYMNNLNAHPAYAQLRQERRKIRRAGQNMTGLKLADQLTHYATQAEYASRIKAVIQAF